MAAIASNLQGCKCFANLETKLWTKTLASALVQIKGNLSQIYPISFFSLKKNCIGENLFANFFSSLKRICTLANLI